METFMRVNILQESVKDVALTDMLRLEISMKVNGFKIRSMDLEK
jgi:hypothetical protein